MAIAVVGDAAQPLLNFFTAITAVTMKITEWIIKIAPVGVLFLVCIVQTGTSVIESYY
jgi:Na+/H+-dicarboxylate symporter